MAEQQIDAARILSSFSTKIKSLEEKQESLREKTLLLGQSFLKQEETLREEVAILKDEIKELRSDLERVKERVENILQEMGNFARKEELKLVEKYMKIWEPLKFVKADEVKKMISDALEKEHTKHEKPAKQDKNYIN